MIDHGHQKHKPRSGVRVRQDIASASWNASCVNSQTGDQKQDRPIFRLTLRPEPHVADPVYALRGLLKRALRSYGLRAIDVCCEQTPPEPAPPSIPINGDSQ